MVGGAYSYMAGGYMVKETVIIELHPSDDEIAIWKEELDSIVRDRKKKLSDEEVAQEIEIIIAKAKKGWKKAPKTFSGRVRNIAKTWGKETSGRKKKKEDSKKDELYINKDRETILGKRKKEIAKFLEFYSEFIESLSEGEKDYFSERVKFYLKEFKFNMSSDLPLLLELITMEMVHRRLMTTLASSEDNKEIKSSASLMKSIVADMSSIQATLGITRIQRQKAMGGTEGSVAEVSVLLEKKKKQLAKIKEEEEKQEELLMQAKISRSDLNPIPDDKEELRNVLKKAEEIEVK